MMRGCGGETETETMEEKGIQQSIAHGLLDVMKGGEFLLCNHCFEDGKGETKMVVAVVVVVVR